jgi:tetratricopeptide (TPR) repeat protein
LRADVELSDVAAGRDVNIAGRDIVQMPPPSRPRALPPDPRAGIPPPPIEHFTDRETELAGLHQNLQEQRRAVLHGLGGVGKTQLSLRYLEEHRDLYPDGSFWLRAEHSSTLLSDLASLAWRLELPEREEPEQERQIEAVHRWLRQHQRWLLVLDNLDREAEEAAWQWLPPDLPGHLVLTTRGRASASRPLDPFPPEVATSFLLHRAGRSEEAAARAIAEELGGLPLALEQASAYLLQNSWHSLTDYLRLLRSRTSELLREGTPEGYPLPVASTWELSFSRIEAEKPAAANLLRLCTFFAPDSIPLDVLQAGAGQLPQGLGEALEDEIECDRLLAALRDYSLLERQQDALRMHRLVQWAVRESLIDDQRQRWGAAAIRLLGETFPTEVEDPRRWPLCARLLPHVQVVLDLVEELVEPESVSWLLEATGRYLQVRGELAAARPLLERALEIRERVLGPDHPYTAASLNNLALLLQDQGELAAARPLLERTLAIRDRVLGPDHPDTASSLNNLAGLLQDQGELAAARPLYERALDIRERVLGPDRPDTASSLNNLAGLLQDQDELAVAQPLLERALAIRERVLGPDHPDTAASFNNLAGLLRAQGELAGARPLLERALNVHERVLGPDHPNTAQSLNNLALLLQDQGDLAAARPLLERALEIRERVLGPDHPNTAQSLNNLALLLQDQRELAAARPLYEQALDVFERMLGLDHPTTSVVRANLNQLIEEIRQEH